MVSCWGVSKHIQPPNHMAHHPNPELLNNVLQLLTEQGHDGFAEGLRLLGNEAMRLERHAVLQAQPYERTATRQGYANGSKPKTRRRRPVCLPGRAVLPRRLPSPLNLRNVLPQRLQVAVCQGLHRS